jgi:hypothetical protein
LSEAEAVTVTVCAVVYVVPDAGLVMDAVGGVVSATGMFTVTAAAADRALLFAASQAFAVQLWDPFVALVTDHE